MNLQRKDTEGTIKFFNQTQDFGDVPVATFFEDQAADLFALIPEMIKTIESVRDIECSHSQRIAHDMIVEILEKVAKTGLNTD